MSSDIFPVLSVCIPTYCGETYLGAAIESVLQQEFTDYELIIIDDNSPDETEKIVSKYSDKRIRYIKNAENLGPEANWNKCLQEAKGKYFKLLPHDDMLSSDCLSRQVAVLENDVNESIALVFCARHIIDHNQRIIMSRNYGKTKEGIIPGRDVIRKSIRFGTNLIGEPGAVMFRKSLAEKIGFFDGSIPYIIDLDYWFRLLLNGNAYYINEPLASFRVIPSSWSVTIGNRQSGDFRKFIKRYMQKTAYQLTFVDGGVGSLIAQINNYLRILFYNLYVSYK